jgi:hypothetical protein
MDHTRRIMELEERCRALERINAELARDLAAAQTRLGAAPAHPLGIAAAAVKVARAEQVARTDDTP